MSYNTNGLSYNTTSNGMKADCFHSITILKYFGFGISLIYLFFSF
jgi:hypothetical protein